MEVEILYVEKFRNFLFPAQTRSETSLALVEHARSGVARETGSWPPKIGFSGTIFDMPENGGESPKITQKREKSDFQTL